MNATPEPDTGTVRVNFHCHSNCSDGTLSPGQLARELAAAGVCSAALTDHDSLDGLGDFDQTLDSLGTGVLTGVEITVEEAPDSLHILAYGFDPENRELQQLIRHRRQTRHGGVRSDLRRAGAAVRARLGRPRAPAPERVMTGVAGIIRAVHRAGGSAYLAHPLTACADMERLEAMLPELRALGLDGIEALYAGYPEPVQRQLEAAAGRNGLLICAGTDFHGFDRPGLNQIACQMPAAAWELFRKAHRLLPRRDRDVPAPSREATSPASPLRRRLIRPRDSALQWRRFSLRIVFPTLLALVLSVATIFGIILPAFEKNLMDRKREMIRELVYSALSTLTHYDAEAGAGRISREEARRRAVSYIESLRYGAERKDYFWVTDLHPRMIMHPYRTDLNGTDLSDFRDVRGSRMFVAFVAVARSRGEGFVEYYWQWKDNPERVAPKQSFVKLFEPWGWVIGTGIYLDDVNREIASVTGWLVRLCLGISFLIMLLLAYITRESLAIEKRRSRSEAALQDSHEKYAALVAATTEGTLMVLDGRCAYSNGTMAETLGYSEEELSRLDFRDLFPREDEGGRAALSMLEETLEGAHPPDAFEADLRKNNGERVRVLCSITRIALGGKTGFILVARDISHKRILEEELNHNRERLKALVEKADIGVFRITADRDPRFVEANRAARTIFGFAEDEALASRGLLEFIADRRERTGIASAIESGSVLPARTVDIANRTEALSFVSLSLLPVRDEAGVIRHYDGIVEDKTIQKRSEEERDALLGELQSELLFMNEPMKDFARALPQCPMDVSIRDAAAIMSRDRVGILGVTGGDGLTVLGVVTDRDLRERVLSAGLDLSRPVYEIMSAPVVSLPDSAAVFEAILKMEQNRVHHLPLRNSEGRILSRVSNFDLMRLYRCTPAVISGEIRNSKTVAELVEARRRLPWLIKSLLRAGARPRIVSRIMTRISDAIVERLIEIATGELGAPPASFCFMALGSEGRGEQTLVTDQDNALIYAHTVSGDDEAGGPYFLRLGERVSEGLHRAGYAFCPGEIMARNPRWNRPIPDWRRYFREWITQASPQDLLEFNTFFDFRCIWGEWELARELRATIHALIREHPPFLLHLAQNALLYKPPIGFFGKIVGEPGGEDSNVLNLKDVMLPIVNFARLYSLRHAVIETNTLDRLRGLFEVQAVKKAFYEEILQAYSFLMELRLRNQILAMDDNRPPDNLLDLGTITSLEETLLKESFSVISTIRRKISYDFLGQA